MIHAKLVDIMHNKLEVKDYFENIYPELEYPHEIEKITVYDKLLLCGISIELNISISMTSFSQLIILLITRLFISILDYVKISSSIELNSGMLLFSVVLILRKKYKQKL